MNALTENRIYLLNAWKQSDYRTEPSKSMLLQSVETVLSCIEILIQSVEEITNVQTCTE
jgi:hypothetical protein